MTLLLAICLFFVLLPTAYALRIWAACTMLGATAIALSPAIPFDLLGPVDGIGTALLLILPACAGLALGVRWVLGRRWPRLATAPSPAATRRSDLALAVVVGFCLGLILTIALAAATRGAPGGLGFHVAVALSALGLTVMAWRQLSGAGRPCVMTLLLVCAAKIMAGGVMLPGQIDRQVRQVQGDAPGCLRGGNGPVTLARKRLLTLPAATAQAPGLTLTVMTPSGPEHYRWSLRGGRFMIMRGDHDLGPCPETGA